MNGVLTSGQEIGRLGEDIAVKYLKNKGFSVVARNYRKKYGEIDIVAKKSGILHFVEVKSVSCEMKIDDVSRVTNIHRPEDNVHSAKLKHLARAIQSYLAGKSKNSNIEWCFDVITVKINKKDKKVFVAMLENLIL